MTPTRLAPIGLMAALTALGCGEPRGAGADLSTVTIPGGAADGSDVVVGERFCVLCHGDPARGPVAGDAQGQAFAPPVDVDRAATGDKVGAHMAHLRRGPFSDGVRCASCHVVPQDAARHTPGVRLRGLATTSWSGPPLNASFVGGTCTATYCHGNFRGGVGSVTLAWNAGTVTCGTSCHSLPPPTAPHASYPTPGPVCATCHGGTVDATGRAILPGGLHVNGVPDGGESSGAIACGGCHPAIFAAVTGTATSRHALALDTPADDPTAWTGATLSTVPAGSRSCVNMCHSDHPHTLTSPATTTHENNVYVDASTQAARGDATLTSATRAKTDFLVGQANGGLCTSCHRNPINAGDPTVTVASYGGSAHDFTSFTSGTTWTWQYVLHSGAFDRNCTKCHASPVEGNTPAAGATGSGTVAVHSSANPSLLAGTTNPAGAASGFVCYNCHGSGTPAPGAQGNRSGKDLATQVAKLRSHPVNADAVHDSVAEAAGATFGNALGGKARHASCMDCHAPHEAKGGGLHATPGNLAGPALDGAWGPRLSSFPAANFAAPLGANFTKQVIVAGSDVEATLCFKCHSSFYWGAGTPPNGLSPNGAQTTPPETDTAQEFNPNDRSGHPVLASLGGYPNSLAPKALAAAQMQAPWTSVGTQTMTCSDCHGADAAAPAAQGPHGSSVQFMLKGTNAGNWPDVTLATIGSSWCANCHVASTAGNNVHGTSNHSGFRCYQCHLVVPHGGKLSRLMADNDTMPSRYAFGGTLNTQNLQGFTKAATRTGYTTANCRAQCAGEHSGQVPTESW